MRESRATSPLPPIETIDRGTSPIPFIQEPRGFGFGNKLLWSGLALGGVYGAYQFGRNRLNKFGFLSNNPKGNLTRSHE